MQTVQITTNDSDFNDPMPRVVDAIVPGVKDSYSIEVKGMGPIQGIAFTIPAHTMGTISGNLKICAISSADIATLNNLAKSMLNASQLKQIEEYEKTSASANLSIWSWFFGGGAECASYMKTHEIMMSKGLTRAQISLLMEALSEFARKASPAHFEFFVNNSENDYPVSGDIYLYTLSGTVKTENGATQYRMFANRASAGGPPPTGGGAPSTASFG